MFRVLLVDDEQIILDGLSNLISWEEFGFSEVGLATGVPQALEMMKKTPYDVVITDIFMQGQTGIDLLRILSERHTPTRAIVLSSYSNFSYIKSALQYGIENYSINELAVNEQNPLAKGFYEHMGFRVYGRTDLDEQGNPYPLLYMSR